MLRIAGTRDGKPFALLGIDKQNVKRLKKGEPISVQLKELGLPDVEVIIHYGDTLEYLLDELEAVIDADTKVAQTEADNT